jgi:RNA polymerase sigma factor (sigma-70 family)
MSPETVYRDYGYVVENVLKKWYRAVIASGAEVDDVRQTGYVTLVRAAAAFNGRYDFGAFAYVCVERDVVKAVLKAGRRGFTRVGRFGEGRSRSVPAVRPVDDLITPPEAKPTGPVTWGNAEWATVLAPLTPRERKLVELRFRHGVATRRIAAKAGLTQRAVCCALRKALGRLRVAYPDPSDVPP